MTEYLNMTNYRLSPLTKCALFHVYLLWFCESSSMTRMGFYPCCFLTPFFQLLLHSSFSLSSIWSPRAHTASLTAQFCSAVPFVQLELAVLWHGVIWRGICSQRPKFQTSTKTLPPQPNKICSDQIVTKSIKVFLHLFFHALRRISFHRPSLHDLCFNP